MTALTFNQVLKGYPEFNPDQARGEDGRWGGGSVSGAARGRPRAQRTIPGRHAPWVPERATPTLRQAIEAGAINRRTSQAEWDKLTPGFKREVMRSAEKRISGFVRDLTGADVDKLKFDAAFARIQKLPKADVERTANDYIFTPVGMEGRKYRTRKDALDRIRDVFAERAMRRVRSKIIDDMYGGGGRWGDVPTKKAADLEPGMVARVRRQAKESADDFVAVLKPLSEREQVSIAEALIAELAKHLPKAPMGKGYPEFNPDQARGEGGKWTAGGVARAVGRGALTAGGALARGMQDALSTITLVPSSKTTAGQAIKDWYGRLDTDIKDAATSGQGREPALVELAARVMFTIAIGALMWALAHAFVGGAAGAVGSAVGQALRMLIR